MSNFKLNAPDLRTESIEINDKGDSITLVLDNAAFLQKFLSMAATLKEKAQEIGAKISELDQKEDADRVEALVEQLQLNNSFSEECKTLINGVFGSDTVENYFYKQFEAVEEFVPTPDCYVDFITEITPVINEIYGNKSILDKEKMKKYKPVDYKKTSK